MRSPSAAEDADATVVMIMSVREVKDVRLQMIAPKPELPHFAPNPILRRAWVKRVNVHASCEHTDPWGGLCEKRGGA